MLIRVLGSSAGGGLPQWNCACANCESARRGDGVVPRTQESVSLSADSRRWVILNASPDIGRQISLSPALAPKAKRHTPVSAVVLTNGDLDHCLGLFSLRESQPLVVYATERVFRGLLERNAIARTLLRFPDQVRWVALVPGSEEELEGPDREPVGLTVRAVEVPGKLPLHLEGLLEPHPEDNVGLVVRETSTGRGLGYFPGVGRITPGVRSAVMGLACVFFDGTFWSSDELPAQGVSGLRAEQMAHQPVGGHEGSLVALSGIAAGRRIFIHINNTNPMLRPGSEERAEVERAGWEIAEDTLEFRV